MSRTRRKSCSPAAPSSPVPGVVPRTRSRSHSPVPTCAGVRPARLRELVKNARIPSREGPGLSSESLQSRGATSVGTDRNPIRYGKPATSSRLLQHSRSMVHLRKSLSLPIESQASDSSAGVSKESYKSLDPLAKLQKPSARDAVGDTGGGAMGVKGQMMQGRLPSPQDAASDAREELSGRARTAMDKSDRIKGAMGIITQAGRTSLLSSEGRSLERESLIHSISRG